MAGKHTSGPWKLCFHLQNKEKDESCPCGFPGDIWGADGEHVVCTMGPIVAGTDGVHPPRYSRETELANAALIAAAPEMLEALKKIATWANGFVACCEDAEGEHPYAWVYVAADEAIRKAEAR